MCSSRYVQQRGQSEPNEQVNFLLLIMDATKEGNCLVSQAKRKETLLQLKDKRKELQANILQTESDPEKQKRHVTQHMKKFRSRIKPSPLIVEGLVTAEAELIRLSQQHEYTEEINALLEGSTVKKKSPLYKLDPQLQNGLLRVGGRLNEAAMPQESNNPVILPKNSLVATLILQHIHEEIGHCGRNYMPATLRQKYWIPQANSAIRKL